VTEPLVLGLDIGGTSSRARLVRGDDLVAEASGGTASVSAAGTTAARTTLHDLLAQIGVGAVDAVCLGTAGSGSADMDRFLRSVLSEVVSTPVLLVVNDAELLLPAAGHDEGVAVVAGTGAKAVGRVSGRRAVSGGWGYLLGDEGGGYWIVREAVREVLRRDDAGEDVGPVGGELLDAVGCHSAAELVERFHGEPAPGGWAAHAPLVIATSDPVVGRIVRAAGLHLAGLAANVLRHLDAPAGTPVVLAGGVLTGLPAVADAVRDAVRRTHPDARIEVLDRPPVAGAVRLAQQAASGARTS
jgi:glucosamine kinase